MEKKRFIAGATCPDCKAQDTVYTFLQDGQQWRACASCDMRQNIESLASAGQELPTRVNQPRLGDQVLAHETPVEPVTLVDMKSGKGKPSGSS
ncbi:MAG: YheV family putative metal-binding protein [Gammaproteobacteria bacterium]|nr:YheV family putative metal-binding protein [Gammaproteobacteria bacterium]MBT8152214.1 YheV family putative metal-binding protein [Gammaproteobacteria bacterium]NND38846.1 YheV family putative metal-binding protein [Pseudomonadales bacterium]NNL10188.1 YheV family putative metal-binding protein [Pseudomonadales bacterium]